MRRVVAGLLPIIATALYGEFGWIAPALMFSALGVISVSCALPMRETAPTIVEAGLRERADRRLRSFS